MSNWIPVKEKRPDADVEVLLQIKCNGRMYVGYRCSYGEDVYKCVTARGSSVSGMKPIAWMPLPEIYKDVK